MNTSIDSLKLAVSWKGSQIPGAKFTVKVCVHSLLRWEGEIILCVIFVLFCFVREISFALEKTPRIICNCKLVPGHYREYQKTINMG